MSEVSVTVTIDTEEDNWGSYSESGATTENIQQLAEAHEIMASRGARPTYLVNRPPLVSAPSVEVLGALAAHPEVEIGAHCHPWNTPPSTGSGQDRSMMCGLPLEANRAKVGEVTRLIGSELGVRPRSFRAGRWGFGPSVATALAEKGYSVDASVTPALDWSGDGGADYSTAPRHPYRFDPARPLTPDPRGSMVELPTTIGYLRSHQSARASLRRMLESRPVRHLRLLGVLDGLGLLRRRWLSPEVSTPREMALLVDACVASGQRVLDLTFHSCTLYPGATPFVRDEGDRKRFLAAIDYVLAFCAERGLVFRTLGEVADHLFPSR